MRPYLPPSALSIPEYCDHRHFKETLHRIDFKNYFPKSHRVVFIIVCCDCKKEFGDKGEKVSLHFEEWQNYIDGFVWVNDTLTDT